MNTKDFFWFRAEGLLKEALVEITNISGRTGEDADDMVVIAQDALRERTKMFKLAVKAATKENE